MRMSFGEPRKAPRKAECHPVPTRSPASYTLLELYRRFPRGFWGEFRGFMILSLPKDHADPAVVLAPCSSVFSSELASGWFIRLRVKSALGIGHWSGVNAFFRHQ